MILLSSSLNSFIQLLGVLLIFLFVLVITYFTTKWIGGYQKVQMSGRSFQVVDTIRIANNKLVQVIKMGDVYLVIAVGYRRQYRSCDHARKAYRGRDGTYGGRDLQRKDSRTEWRKRSDDLPGDA